MVKIVRKTKLVLILAKKERIKHCCRYPPFLSFQLWMSENVKIALKSNPFFPPIMNDYFLFHIVYFKNKSKMSLQFVNNEICQHLNLNIIIIWEQ